MKASPELSIIVIISYLSSMRILLNLILSTVAILVTSYILTDVKVDGFFAALVVAIVLGIVNSIVKPVLKILTLPINILTLGLFSLVITALMVMLTDALVPGFTVNGFLPALLFGVLLSLVNWIIFTVIPDGK